MIATQSKPNADRPWLDPAATPQIVIDAVSQAATALSPPSTTWT